MFSLKSQVQKGVFIIAEIGKNQIQSKEDKPVEEYLQNAKELVKLAKESGADAVKFQTHNYEDEQLNIDATSPHFKGADRYSWVKRNTLATPFDKFWLPLKEYCDELGILFFSTPMSRGSAQILEKLNVPLYKVGSGDILDFVTLDYLSKTNKPVLFSTGMSTLEETNLAVNYLKSKNVELGMFHCISKYPCPPEELRLKTIEFFQEKYPELIIGFSDHSIGYESALGAVALGAKMVEKHFSKSRDLWGSDHKVSMTPDEFKEMVGNIRELESNPDKKEFWLNKENVKRGMGSLDKEMSDDESVFRPYFRKSLMAGIDIEEGTIITPEMIYAMRPQKFANALPSEKYEIVIGKKTKKTLNKYDPITLDCLE